LSTLMGFARLLKFALGDVRGPLLVALALSMHFWMGELIVGRRRRAPRPPSVVIDRNCAGFGRGRFDVLEIDQIDDEVRLPCRRPSRCTEITAARRDVPPMIPWVSVEEKK